MIAINRFVSLICYCVPLDGFIFYRRRIRNRGKLEAIYSCTIRKKLVKNLDKNNNNNDEKLTSTEASDNKQ